MGNEQKDGSLVNATKIPNHLALIEPFQGSGIGLCLNP
jgi:hypothetical protein